MISAKKLIKIVPKWHKLSFDKSDSEGVVGKGHFAIYTADERRFVVPLAYLNNSVFRELLKMSEEEYGLPGDGPIVLPCDSVFMDFFICLIRQGRAAEPLLKSVAKSRCTLYRRQMDQRFLVH